MKSLAQSSYIFFIATYLCIFVWLYQGVSNTYNFCLDNSSPANLIGILAGVFGILTLVFYDKHERGMLRALGLITFVFGILVAVVVLSRYFFSVAPNCGF